MNMESGLEEAIKEYTNYVQITFYVVIFISLISLILFIIFVIKKRKKRKIREKEFLEKNKSMIFCTTCGKSIDGDSVYCKYCGKYVNK